ncbi:MAG: hypothetical protein AAGA99_08415 [Actinomycetota bacterium]
MTILVLFILAVMWAAVLLPPVVRNRQNVGRSRDSVGAFRSQLSTLGRTGPVVYAPASRLQGRDPVGTAVAPLGEELDGGLVPPGMPRNPHEAELRRRDVIRVLAAAAVLSLIVALLMPSTMAWLLHLGMDGLLGGYVLMVARLRSVTMERDQKVHYLRPATVEAVSARAAAPALHRAGS